MRVLLSTIRTRRLSNRFVAPARSVNRFDDLNKRSVDVFAEGGWPAIRSSLEIQGWSPAHLDHIHEQLRQGWPLAIALRHVSIRFGTCPCSSKRG